MFPVGSKLSCGYRVLRVLQIGRTRGRLGPPLERLPRDRGPDLSRRLSMTGTSPKSETSVRVCCHRLVAATSCSTGRWRERSRPGICALLAPRISSGLSSRLPDRCHSPPTQPIDDTLRRMRSSCGDIARFYTTGPDTTNAGVVPTAQPRAGSSGAFRVSQREREPRRLPRFHDEPWRWPIEQTRSPPAACTELVAWLTPYGSYSRGLLTRDRDGHLMTPLAQQKRQRCASPRQPEA